MSALDQDAPEFPVEEHSRLVLERRGPGDSWDAVRDARVSDLVDCLLELTEEDRENIARVISPKLVERLTLAEHVVDATMDCGLAVDRARKHVANFGREPGDIAPTGTTTEA